MKLGDREVEQRAKKRPQRYNENRSKRPNLQL